MTGIIGDKENGIVVGRMLKRIHLNETDKEMWIIIARTNWQSGEHLQYEKTSQPAKIAEFLSKIYSKEKLIEVKEFAMAKVSSLVSKMREHQELAGIVLSEDVITQAAAHFVGCGVMEYMKCLENPLMALEAAKHNRYASGFMKIWESLLLDIQIAI